MQRMKNDNIAEEVERCHLEPRPVSRASWRLSSRSVGIFGGSGEK